MYIPKNYFFKDQYKFYHFSITNQTNQPNHLFKTYERTNEIIAC